MFVIVAYDIPVSRSGRRRLRKIAKIMCGMGTRVQKSVFECSFRDETDMDRMMKRLTRIADVRRDSIRIYRLSDRIQEEVSIIGVGKTSIAEPYAVV